MLLMEARQIFGARGVNTADGDKNEHQGTQQQKP